MSQTVPLKNERKLWQQDCMQYARTKTLPEIHFIYLAIQNIQAFLRHINSV